MTTTVESPRIIEMSSVELRQYLADAGVHPPRSTTSKWAILAWRTAALTESRPLVKLAILALALEMLPRSLNREVTTKEESGIGFLGTSGRYDLNVTCRYVDAHLTPADCITEKLSDLKVRYMLYGRMVAAVATLQAVADMTMGRHT